MIEYPHPTLFDVGSSVCASNEKHNGIQAIEKQKKEPMRLLGWAQTFIVGMLEHGPAKPMRLCVCILINGYKIYSFNILRK